MTILVILTWVLVTAILVAVAYRALFAAAYLLKGRGRKRTISVSERRFTVVIPAHDEELLIGHAITSLTNSDYPNELLDIHVIADNCSDQTALVARELGAQVSERFAPEARGKGQALRWMLARLDLSRTDAVVFLDADVLVEPRFFRAMSGALDAGGRCLQGYNGIANPGENALTRLLAVTSVMKNLLFNGGKATLGLSVFLSTGIVFAREVIEELGWDAMSIGEDLEQTFYLLERGERIRFVPDARTRAQEATTLRQGYTQRQRWATGRRALAGRARRAVLTGIRARSLHLVDAGLELLMPTYSKLMNWSLVGLVLAIALRPWSPWLLPAICIALVYQLAEIGVALRLMRADLLFIASLMFAPVFLVWKAGIDVLALLGHHRNAWIRTARTPHVGPVIEAPNLCDRTRSPTGAGGQAQQAGTGSTRDER